MVNQDLIKKLFELNELARVEGAKRLTARTILQELSHHSGRTFLGMTGPRGAGKTILLQQLLAKRSDAIYISIDQLPPEIDLFDLFRVLAESYSVKLLLLDEVHYHPDINRHLKASYDFMSDLRIIFTSSVALKMNESAHDLSRRLKLLPTPYFSFREFLLFSLGKELPRLSLQDLLKGESATEQLVATTHFHHYLCGGMLPFALEAEDWQELLQNILTRVIKDDLPRISSLTLEDTQAITRTVTFIGRSPVEGLNPTSIAKNIGASRYKVDQYLELLEQAFIVQRVFPHGTNVLQEPKILLVPPYRLLFKEFEQALGGLREDFAVAALRGAGVPHWYFKDRRGKKTPDYFVTVGETPLVLEVGGRTKSRSQLKDLPACACGIICRDGPPYGAGVVPLALLGMQ